MSVSQHGPNCRPVRATPSGLQMINTPVEHPVDVVRVDGKNRWVLFQIQRFRFFNLNVHRFCILGLMATGDVEEKGTGFDGHLMLDGQHGVFVSVPSVACSIKHMAQSVANPTCTEPGNSDGFMGVSGFFWKYLRTPGAPSEPHLAPCGRPLCSTGKGRGLCWPWRRISGGFRPM